MKTLTKQVLLGAALAVGVSGIALAAGESEQRDMSAAYGTQTQTTTVPGQTTTLPGDQLTYPGIAQTGQPRQQGFHPLQAMRNAGDKLLHAPKTKEQAKAFNDNTGE